MRPYLYRRPCPSVGPSVGRAVGNAFVKIDENEVLRFKKTRPRRPTMRPYSVMRMFEFLFVAVIEEMVGDSFNPHFIESMTFPSKCLTLRSFPSENSTLRSFPSENSTLRSFLSENMTLWSFSSENMTLRSFLF